jgi:large subunit ribosomal protein L30
MARIEIKLVRSLSGRPETHRAVVRSLGLRRMNHTVIQPDNDNIRGMVSKVSHMLSIRTVEG